MITAPPNFKPFPSTSNHPEFQTQQIQRAHNEFELRSPPTDGISRVRYSFMNPTLLAVSSWDSSVRLYDTSQNILKTSFQHRASVLDCCFSEDSSDRIYSSGLDKTVKSFDIKTGVEFVVGNHEKGVRCIEYDPDHRLLISGSWDSTLKLWDERMPCVSTGKSICVGKFDQPDKVYTMCLSKGRVIVGTAGRHVLIYDLRKMNPAIQRRESSLKYQTRCIQAFPDGTGFALSSIEGRVAMEYFDPSPEIQAKKYAFKCHRTTTNNVDTVYPVNCISFHPVFSTFATGGCDGVVNIWDGQHKKRLCQFKKYPTSISSLSFNIDGSSLAIASSYTYEEGEKPHPPDRVMIRSIVEAEVRPKSRGPA